MPPKGFLLVMGTITNANTKPHLHSKHFFTAKTFSTIVADVLEYCTLVSDSLGPMSQKEVESFECDDPVFFADNAIRFRLFDPYTEEWAGIQISGRTLKEAYAEAKAVFAGDVTNIRGVFDLSKPQNLSAMIADQEGK